MDNTIDVQDFTIRTENHRSGIFSTTTVHPLGAVYRLDWGELRIGCGTVINDNGSAPESDKKPVYYVVDNEGAIRWFDCGVDTRNVGALTLIDMLKEQIRLRVFGAIDVATGKARMALPTGYHKWSMGEWEEDIRRTRIPEDSWIVKGGA